MVPWFHNPRADGMATPEALVKRKVDAILKRHDVWYFKPVSNGMGTHGIPDYICCVPPSGTLLGIECKSTDGMAATALQRAQLARIADHGGSTFLATPGTLGALEQLITKLTNATSPHQTSSRTETTQP